MTDEELVRKVWKSVHIEQRGEQILRIFDGGIIVRQEDYTDAAQRTRAYLEKVRQKQEEIDLLKAEESIWPNHFAEHPAFARILFLLEAQLAELESGLTDWAKAHVEELLKEH